jgi:hypothetical protein
MAIATATTIVESLLALLANSRPTIDEINAACLAKGLPPAFTESDSPLGVDGNLDYRFEGFGITVVRVFPPKFALAFWVHYKPDSVKHVALGKFMMPISSGKLSLVRSLIEKL